VSSNTNSPKSVIYSAILYALRCLVDSDIPLNHGCLLPIQVLLREGSILDPSEDRAIVGGNVLTSQTVTDLILRCF
jgi:5-oxoprolinase (ATP-hydrolysing)